MDNTIPNFSRIFSGNLKVDASMFPNAVTGPNGKRVLIPVKSSQLLDPVTRNVLGSSFPGLATELGLISPVDRKGAERFFLDVIIVYKMEDGGFLHLKLSGAGELGVKSTAYARIETDSEKYEWLNALFLIFNIVFDGEEAVIGIYGLKDEVPESMAI